MILLTGATGTVGRRLAAALVTADVAVRALVRRPQAAAQVLDRAVELFPGDCLDRPSLDRALHGADRVFVLAPLTAQLAELEMAVVAAAADAGGVRVVKLSTAGVRAEPAQDEAPQYRLHRQSERFIEASGLAWTHLRPGPFFQNLLSFAAPIAATHAFYGAWGDARMAYVDADDVAEAATRVLLDPGHEGRAYTLTGPQALTHDEVAAALTTCLKHPVRYADGPVSAAGAAMRARGMDPWLAGSLQQVMHHARTAPPTPVTDDVEQLTGRPPTDLATFLARHAGTFARLAPTA